MSDSNAFVIRGNLKNLGAEVDRLVNLWLEESAGELEAQTKMRSRVDTGQTKGSYSHVVDSSRKEARVGSNLANAIWEEYGTGEYALNGKGRKGWWVYVKGSDGTHASGTRKYYAREQAIRIAAMMREDGLDAYATCGKRPNRPIFRAFSENEKKIVDRLHSLLRNMEVDIE